MSICPVCENTEWIEAYKINQYGIEECTGCSFARINPLPIRETRAGYYKEKVIESNTKKKTQLQMFSRVWKKMFSRAMNRNKNEIFYNKLTCYLSSGARVLDVGCGDGSFLNIAKRQFICSGIEISEYLAVSARKQDNIKVIFGDFLTADFSNEKYDGITLISLLEHLDDPIQAIKKCFHLLSNKGILLMKTVNYGCLNRRIRKDKWTGFRPPDHMIYFSPSNLRYFLKKMGFKKIRISAWAFNDNMYCDAWK